MIDRRKIIIEKIDNMYVVEVVEGYGYKGRYIWTQDKLAECLWNWDHGLYEAMLLIQAKNEEQFAKSERYRQKWEDHYKLVIAAQEAVTQAAINLANDPTTADAASAAMDHFLKVSNERITND
jgi:hypothetical protein